ncbi:hypothetical protein [Pantoea sp. DY-5]|uniref:hypothetical protein n=1 Tax=Pantoea sp. DY-5 TaxID=2871488 RepID=UPI001C966F98|nr:hypothetical protein [Pantoea sp. DY-5]MBY4839934.1 hypothetical protein [Pantoea sp. DY-5]
MEKRIAIYEFESTLNSNEIVNRLLGFNFTKDSLSGFTLSKNEFKGIIFKHIKKTINTDIVITPFGEELENTTVDYAINDVKILGNELYIFNPSRSLAAFRNELLKALDFKCTISTKLIDLNYVIELLSSQSKNTNVTNVELYSYDLLDESRIKMIIESNKDLVQKSEKIFFDIKPKITKIGFEISLYNTDYFVEVSYKGIVKIKGDLIEKNIENEIFNIILNR